MLSCGLTLACQLRELLELRDLPRYHSFRCTAIESQPFDLLSLLDDS